MEKNIQDKITALEAAINSPATPENIKETMRKALYTLRNGKVDDDKEINSIIMKLISYKLNSDNYNEFDYNSNFEKLLSFDEEKVISRIRDFIQKNQNDVSLFEGQNKIQAQEFINRLFELMSELKYEFNTRNHKSLKTYTTIKSCLLDDGDDSDDYIYEGKLIHNIEVLPKDTWEIVEFYKYGVVLKHVPTSVLADSKPNKNVSLDELKSLFASDKIEIDGIEKGNTKVFNLCVKAIIKCIDSLDMAAYKENLLAELNASKNELEKTIEASNLLESEKNAILSEKSNLEKESAEKIQTLESDISAKSISMQEAKAIQDAETARLKKQLEDLEALNSMRTLIDMLTDDIAKKDLKYTPISDSNGKIKVKSITIHNAEGSTIAYDKFPKEYYSYEDANKAIIPVYEDAIKYEGNSNKSRATVVFEDDTTYEMDLLVGEKHDNPIKGNVIGKHIKDYLDRELKLEHVSDESKREIREFLEKYDLGFDNNPNPTGGDYDDINKFVDYVNDFYGKEGIYAEDFANHGFTKEEIKEAVNKYISDIDKRNDDNFTWGGGDSIDRERVRTYLEKMDSGKFENGGTVSEEEIDEFVYEYGGDRKEAEETLKRRKARLSPEENKRLSILNKRSLNNSLTDSEDIEFDKLVHKYRGWKYSNDGKVNGTWGTWGQYFPEAGRTGMYKGVSVIVTANRAGDILFDELDENEKVVKSDKVSLNEFRSYFRPFEPRETDVIYEKGGFVFNENAEMVLNQNHQIKHHTEELGNIVNEKTHVPAWVVSKVSDAANDLSDATHYLDGENSKMENGGEVSSILKEFNELTAVNNHDDAAILLAEHYGTDEEVSKLKRIQREHDKKGYISKEDQDFRDSVSNKYYYRLKNLNIDTVSLNRLKNDFSKEPEIFTGSIVKRGNNEFKIDGEFFYMKTPDTDWVKFRKINFNIQ